jgi:hypothetical protein
MALIGFVHVDLWAEEQTPNVRAKQQANEKIQFSVGHDENANALLASLQEEHHRTGGPNSEEEGTEFWPPVFGYKLKVTDTLVAAFTGLLFFATIALYAATKNLVKSSERTARRQLRSYVFIEGATLYDGSTLETPDPKRFNEPGVTMAFKNVGQTPAYDSITWAKIEVLPVDSDRLLKVPRMKFEYYRHLGPNGVTQKGIWLGKKLTPQEIEDIRAKKSAIYLFGRIQYRDCFRQKHFANFRFFYNGIYPPNPKDMVFNACRHGNNADY